MKKILDSNWLRAVQFKCNTTAKSAPVQITLDILDYDWLKDNRKFSKSMTSRKMMTKIFCEKKGRENGSNKSRFTLATDDTIEELRNGAKKCQHQQKYVVLVKCVEDVVRRKDHSFGNRGTRTG